MEGVGLPSLVASLVVVTTCIHIFFTNIHALENLTTPSSKNSPTSRILKVGVPWKSVFTEFVSVEKNGTNFTAGGFCVKVFEASIKTLNYSIHYIPYNGYDNNYDFIIHQIVLKVLRLLWFLTVKPVAESIALNILISFLLALFFSAVQKLDAAVGDFAITSKRSREVLFAQPFFDSGLVAVVPFKDQDIISFGWVFTKPFTAQLWLLMAGFLITGGMVVYILEHRNIRRLERQPRNHLGSMLWFSFITWFTNQDDIRTAMGRIVLVAWFFVIGILQSCYTANLSAILTAPRLEPTLNDINSVVASNLRIGYQMGSAVADGFVEYYGVSKQRRVPLPFTDYYKALSRGDVGAIVDERPYMESLVAKHCDRLAFAGQTFTIQNWGFAFDRMDYELVRDISIRILELSENGELIRLQQQWLPYYNSDCSKYNSDQSGTIQLQVQHFWGLFVIAGLVSAIVLFLYTVHRKWNSSIVASPTSLAEGSSGPTPEGSSGPTAS